jgi:hypothetical protein
VTGAADALNLSGNFHQLALAESRHHFYPMRNFPKTFSDILAMEHRWPKKGDRLLRTSDDWQTSASFAPHQMSRDAFIWDGYMTAGATLIDEAERRPHERYTLVYPILFNYRHGLETAMKWTIERYGTLANVALDPDVRNHDLWALWKQCKAILLSVPTSDDDEPLRAVEQVVKDFHDLDQYAVALRYSKNKDGVTILLPDKPIDLVNLQGVMEGVDNFFKGVDGMLNDILSSAPKY